MENLLELIKFFSSRGINFTTGFAGRSGKWSVTVKSEDLDLNEESLAEISKLVGSGKFGSVLINRGSLTAHGEN
jgi:hypothetical protein